MENTDSDRELFLKLMDLYKQKRMEDYRAADEYLLTAYDVLSVGDFTDEERTELMNAVS